MLLLLLISSHFLSPGNEALPIFESANPPSLSTLETFTSHRSAYSIVWSCIVTTFLCAWVSLHPNIIRRRGGSWERAGQKVRLFLVTVIAPELVIVLASMERQAARKTKVAFGNNGIGISMRHAHFIEMGGFALCFPEDKVRAEARQEKREVKVKNDDDEVSARDDEIAQVATAHNEEPIQQVSMPRENHPTMMKNKIVSIADDDLDQLRYIETLSARRLEELLKSETPLVKFPLITECELGDRSKANVLAKFITAIQALWFIVQCIVRGAKGLAITELELTTFALASLNGVMLFLWRHKPRDVEVQIPMYLSEDSTKWEETWEETWENNKKEWEKRKEELETKKSRERAGKDQAKLHRCLLVVWRWLLRYTWQSLFNMENWKKFWVGFSGLHRQSDEDVESDGPEITAEQLHRALRDFQWSTVSDFVRLESKGVMSFLALFFGILFLLLYIGIFGIFLLLFFGPSPILFLLLKSRRVRNVYNAYLAMARRETFAYTAQAAIVGTVFGGLHLVALSGAFYFPTETEKKLWVIMASALTAIPYLFAGSVNANASLEMAARWVGGLSWRRPHHSTWIQMICYSNFCILLLITYTSARLCIIALTFAMLRSQPATAYLAVDWTKIFPHASS